MIIASSLTSLFFCVFLFQIPQSTGAPNSMHGGGTPANFVTRRSATAALRCGFVRQLAPTHSDDAVLVPIRYWSDEDGYYRTMHVYVEPEQNAKDVAIMAARMAKANYPAQQSMLYLDDENMPEYKPLLKFLGNMRNGGILELDYGWDMPKRLRPYLES